jgi:hypothetical protein
VLSGIVALASLCIGVAVDVSGIENAAVAVGLWVFGGLLLAGVGITAASSLFLPRVEAQRTNRSGLEIRVGPSRYLDDSPYYSLTPGRGMSAIFDLTLINHNTKHKQHVLSAHIELRKGVGLGKTTLFSKPVEIYASPENVVLENIDIEPQSASLVLHIGTATRIPVVTPFPRKSTLVLVLEMVGPTRKIEHLLTTFKHDPKLVPDVPPDNP